MNDNAQAKKNVNCALNNNTSFARTDPLTKLIIMVCI